MFLTTDIGESGASVRNIAGPSAAGIEWCRIDFLDAIGRAIGQWHCTDGHAMAVAIDVPAILRQALTTGASALFMTHNHTSGDPRPSSADIAATRRLAQGCRAIDLRLVDHVIVAAATSFSMRDAGLL